MLKQRQQVLLVEEIDENFKLETKLKSALLSIDRAKFVPDNFTHLAYSLDALPIAANQWISSPLTVAKMTQYLDIKKVDSILEIGCGSGYQAAVLSKLCRRVFTIERISELLKSANGTFKSLELDNIYTKLDDGQNGWSAYAPYDRIIFSATAKSIPNRLFDQLAEGGILIAPIEQLENYHIITRYYKKNGVITSESIEQANFVPVLDGVQRS